MTCLTQAAPFLQMSPPPGGFGERGVGGGGGPLSHLYAGSPTSCFTSGLQAGLRQSHLNKVRRRPHQGRGPGWQGSVLLRVELKQAVLLKPYVLHVVLPRLLGLLLPPPAAQGVGDVAPTHG